MIADAILEARPLVEELLPFRVQITLTDHDTYEPWRERAHDDLVLALSVAVWCALRQRTGSESWDEYLDGWSRRRAGAGISSA